MERSMYAGRVRSEHIGTTITLKGWVSPVVTSEV